MQITKKTENDHVWIAPEGRLDTASAPVLEAAVGEALEHAAVLTLDLEKLEYISSAGLRVLLGAEKAMKQRGEMKLVHVGENIMTILEMTGFTDILTIE
ncbi:MAG: STAS domain-containing protein [Lachnospiraceae bacterium]|nr:STAS domain-containing protein [Lachnospiraceae bacterium]MBP5254461.1 STAS domain-containing protein [Lachnospiraceae bacterium]